MESKVEGKSGGMRKDFECPILISESESRIGESTQGPARYIVWICRYIHWRGDSESEWNELGNLINQFRRWGANASGSIG